MAVSPQTTFESFLVQTRCLIDEELGAWLRQQSWPEEFQSAARHTILGAGKAVRPALVFAVAESCAGGVGRPSEPLRRLALGVEFLHTYSLVHDDLPSMDDDAFRRGRPTLHVLWNEAFAVLAGDAFLTAAFQCVGEAFSTAPEKLPHALRILTRASGAGGMIAGQWLDMSSSSGLADESRLERVHRLKTGELIAASALLGALAVQPLERFLRYEASLKKWAEGLGLLFQQVDDLLDAGTSREMLGKTPGKDLEQDKLTYVSLWGVESLRKRIQSAAEVLSRPDFAPESSLLSSLVAYVARRSH